MFFSNVHSCPFEEKRDLYIERYRTANNSCKVKINSLLLFLYINDRLNHCLDPLVVLISNFNLQQVGK